MHHYPFHPGDYMLDTSHLEPLEDLAYRRLLDLYYTSEENIPLETQSVARRLRLGFEVVEKVLTEFFVSTDSGWKNERCEVVLAEYRAMAERNRVNGKQGGRPKKTQSVASGNPVASHSKPTGNPTKTINHKPINKGIGTLDELREYAVEIGLHASDGESMFDHWESNGWKNGSSKSRDWKAGMRKWKQQGWMPSQKLRVPVYGKPQPVINERIGTDGATYFDGYK